VQQSHVIDFSLEVPWQELFDLAFLVPGRHVLQVCTQIGEQRCSVVHFFRSCEAGIVGIVEFPPWAPLFNPEISGFGGFFLSLFAS